MGQVAFRPMAGIVLAGGRSLRMGRPKALLPWPATQVPFVLHVTETLRNAGIGPLGVVTGEHHDAIAATLASTDVVVLYNARHADGQLGSLLHGLRWAFAQTDGDWALATLVDVPRVQSSTVRTLAQATTSGLVRAIRPVCGDRHGHPVLWRRDVLALLAAADPAQGARSIMRSLAAQGAVCDVPVDDEGVFSDLDTPEDYATLTRGDGP
jgi:molybdenum cofactor cytidylyltransferase